MKYLYDLTDDEADIFEKLEDGEEGTLEERKIYLKVLKECKYDIIMGLSADKMSLMFLLMCGASSILFGWGIFYMDSEFSYFLELIVGFILSGYIGCKCFEAFKDYKLQIEELENDIFNEEQKEKSKSLSDDFILMITKDIKRVQEVKYEGYQKEVVALCTLAKNYLQSKKEKSLTSCSEVLMSDSDFMKILVGIESVIDAKIKAKENMDANIDALIEAMETETTKEDIISEEELLEYIPSEVTELTLNRSKNIRQ